MGYKEDIKLDKYDLDNEVMKQSSLRLQYGVKWSEAVYNRDKLKQQLSLKEAEVALEVRDTPENFGLEKATDKAVASAVQADSRITKIKEKILLASRDVNIYDQACVAFDHKKRMIEIEERLYHSGYYSSPKKREEVKQKEEKKFKEDRKKGLKEYSKKTNRLKRRTK